jgi:hypothetical protein
MPTERIITLRARRLDQGGLAVGMLLGSPKGKVVYRIIEITKLRRSGEVKPHRLRLVCRRLGPRWVQGAATVHPWPVDRQAPR